MKKAQLAVGTVAWTNVSGCHVKVCVVSVGARQSSLRSHYRARRQQATYGVARVDTGRRLHARSARQLHVCGHFPWVGMAQASNVERKCASCIVEWGVSRWGNWGRGIHKEAETMTCSELSGWTREQRHAWLVHVRDELGAGKC